MERSGSRLWPAGGANPPAASSTEAPAEITRQAGPQPQAPPPPPPSLRLCSQEAVIRTYRTRRLIKGGSDRGGGVNYSARLLNLLFAQVDPSHLPHQHPPPSSQERHRGGEQRGFNGKGWKVRGKTSCTSFSSNAGRLPGESRCGSMNPRTGVTYGVT